MPSGPLPICASCVRYSPGLGEDLFDSRPASCAAFPDGIPDDVLLGGVDHREPVEGDRGVRYMPDRSTAGRRLLALYEESSQAPADA
jgi:hypothetical protein